MRDLRGLRGATQAPIKQSGAALILVVVMIVILGGAVSMLVSIVTRESYSSAGHLSGLEAFSLAFSGMEVAERALSLRLNWYQTPLDPVVIPDTPLGSGRFSVNTYLPVGLLKDQIPNGVSKASIEVYTTDRFPERGTLRIGEDLTNGAEFVQYTSKTTNSFTGITRNVTFGGRTGQAVLHEAESRIYPVTALGDPLNAIASPCVPTEVRSFRIAPHPKLLTAGTLDIEGEEIHYSASTISKDWTVLSGVTRCLRSKSSFHAVGAPVTPLGTDSPLPEYEAEIIATGRRPSPFRGDPDADRLLTKTVQK